VIDELAGSRPYPISALRAVAQAVDGDAPWERLSRSTLTSDSWNLRCPPGVRIAWRSQSMHSAPTGPTRSVGCRRHPMTFRGRGVVLRVSCWVGND